MRPGPAPAGTAAAASLQVPAETVVIDTDVWSRIYLASGSGSKNAQRTAERQALTDALTGKTVVIALQTRAELLTFPLVRQLGERRTAEDELAAGRDASRRRSGVSGGELAAGAGDLPAAGVPDGRRQPVPAQPPGELPLR